VTITPVRISAAPYLRHLMRSKEILGSTLLSIHNLRTLIRIAHEMRAAIWAGRFGDYAEESLAALDQSLDVDPGQL
jgi:queuine tRNA-ribosyltransferase